ncbi:MAG: glycosyl hydrolase 115 family protein [Maribacter sp.]
MEEIYLIHGFNATDVELNTFQDLKNDIEKVVTEKVHILSEKEPLPDNGIFYVIGTQKTNGLLYKSTLDTKNTLSAENPGPRGGIWSKVTIGESQKAILLAGSDVQGMQYAVYDYSKEILGVDPLEYWTGKKPEKIESEQLFNFEDKIISPPRVPILCYFENDVDELANYRGKLLEYDWESYTEMINSLVRLRYNAIEFFDMLGRPEFFLRPEYQELNPNYKTDLKYLDKMMDYAHLKGMKIQVNFQLGYQIYPFPPDKADCWSKYKEDWITGWRYYLEKTPLAKTDIFSLRPRNQVWDWEYESSCSEDKIDVFIDVYKVFGELVDEYNPRAEKVLICYSDGMQMWNDGFRPPKDWIVAWSDNGFADFDYYPNTTSDYSFGTYMHAGFWLNHTVHDPYPKQIETVMKAMFQTYNADSYCMVNGQNFRPFLLNLEAYSEVCKEPEVFKAGIFYKKWTNRYFGEKASHHAVESMNFLHKAQKEGIGYVQHLWEIREAVAYLSNSPIERPGKTPVPYTYERVLNDFKHVEEIRKYIDSSLVKAKQGLKLSSNHEFYYSYIYLPALLYADLIVFEKTLHTMAQMKRKYEESGNTKYLEEAIIILDDSRDLLKKIYENRLSGDKNGKWNRWYNPEIRRPNNGFPTLAMLQTVEDNLIKLAKAK